MKSQPDPANLAVVYVTQLVGARRVAQFGITTDSAAGKQKMKGLVRALRGAGATVLLLSFGGRWRARSRRFWPRSVETVSAGVDVEYTSVWDVPLFYGPSAVVGMCRLIRGHVREQRAAGRAVCVMFFNATVEATAIGLYSRIWLGVPICLELSERLDIYPGASRARRAVYHLAKSVLRPFLSGCVLASSTMEDEYRSLPTAVYPGIAFDELADRDRVTLEDPAVVAGSTPVTCLFAGTLDAVRGVPLLLEALSLADADETFPASRLRVVVMGRGPLEADVRQACARLRRVQLEFAGYVSDETTYRDALSRAHVGLALQGPELAFSRACFPIKLLDYPAAGTLVITTDVADIGKMAGPGIVPLDPATPRALVAAWRAVLADPRRYAAVAREGQRIMLETCSIARTGRDVLSLLRQIVPVAS